MKLMVVLFFALVALNGCFAKGNKEKGGRCKKKLAELNKEIDGLKADLQSCKEENENLRDQVEELESKKPIDIYMLSAGWEDTVIGNPGLAKIEVNGEDKSKNVRGHNVVALDRSGVVVGIESFDTYSLGDEVSNALAEFINNLPDDTIVLVATKDSAEKVNAAAVEALSSVGAVDPVVPGFRESWLLVGYKGEARPFFVQQEQGPKASTPSEVKLQICF